MQTGDRKCGDGVGFYIGWSQKDELRWVLLSKDVKELRGPAMWILWIFEGRVLQ